MAKVLLVVYPDPESGYPPAYARDSLPVIEAYPNGQSLPSPSAIDFTPDELLRPVSGELGLQRWLEQEGLALVDTSDKDGENTLAWRYCQEGGSL